jgi:hypothetical protein
MGRAPCYELEGEDRRWRHPAEDIEAEGCPGGWYRSRFIEALRPYMRRRDQHGGRVSNRLLEMCDDRFVIACINLLEAHEDAALSEYYRASSQER